MTERTVRSVRKTVAALVLAALAGPACDDESENPAGVIGFAQEAQSVAENAGYVDLVVQRNGGTTGEVTVRVATQAGTAAAGADFEAVSMTLTWADGADAPATVRVPIRTDVLTEPAETFTVVLSDPTNGAVVGRATAVVTIADTPCTEIAEDITVDTTFPRGCYHVTDNITVTATVTAEAGATFVFDQDVGFYFDTPGVLRALGTAEAPVLFTGVEPIRGYWESLEFYNCARSQSVLDHVIIEYAGGDGACGGLMLDNGTRAAVRDSVLRHSAAYGACLGRDVQLEWARNTLTGNASGAADVSPNAAGQLDAASTYHGNDHDWVRLDADRGSPTVDQTWPAIDVEYRVAGRLWPTAHLTIAAGAELVFEQDAEIYLQSGAALTAVGTAASPIVFRGLEPTAGYWDGVELHGSNSVDNRFEYVTISGGGAEGTAWDANLRLGSTTRISVTNCTITNSAGWGVWVANTVTVNADLETANSFSANALGAVYREP